MKAWQVQQLGEPRDALRLAEVEDSKAGPGEVVIDVKAAGVNFPDILQCQGKYQVRPPLPFTPGSEAAGIVVELGPGVEGLTVGQRVVAHASPPAGGLAEQVAVPAVMAFPIPDTLSFAAATALPVNYQTTWFALHTRAHLQPGESLLVHAGAGGVGSSAIQLGLAAGAFVIATAGGAEKVEVCRELGADLAIDYTEQDFVDPVKEATGGRGADVVYDPVGGDVFDRSRRCIAWDGRLLVIGFTSGRIADAPTNHILLKNYSVVGVHWGASVPRDPTSVPRTYEALLGLHAEGKLDPLVFREVPFEDAPLALELIGSRATWGKVAVTP